MDQVFKRAGHCHYVVEQLNKSNLHTPKGLPATGASFELRNRLIVITMSFFEIQIQYRPPFYVGTFFHNSSY